MRGETRGVPPSRVNWGGDAGDIGASYSGDLLAETSPKIRDPFRFSGELYVTVAIGTEGCQAYRLVPNVLFPGPIVGYPCNDEIDLRRDSVEGFYHGMSVKHHGGQYVLCGPPLLFVPDPALHHDTPQLLPAGDPVGVDANGQTRMFGQMDLFS